MPSLARREWLLLAALALSIFFAYQPCWQGGPIWDDDAHLTRPELRSWQGLGRIWCDVRATTQYYPLLHSAFWIEHRLWGDAPLGYHLVNLLLHATAALLVALILRRLAIPGALLAAAIFALHPVHVESVAWITEQKNTLSAVFYLAALLVYLHFDRKRTIPLYCGSVGTVPRGHTEQDGHRHLARALLVIFWWQRGRLSWRRDVLPLVPFFLLGASAGMVTAWWELQVNHCVGPEFQFTLPERLLIASRAVCFHLGKLCWPAKLTFIYPRWPMDSAAWWPYLFPAGLRAVARGTLVDPAADALAAGGAAVLRWNPLSDVGLFQSVYVPLFAGGQPLPVLGQPGAHYPGGGRRDNSPWQRSAYGHSERSEESGVLLVPRGPSLRSG